MAFLRRKNPDPAVKRDWKGAVEDAGIVFAIVFIGCLAGYGYPPTPQAIYTSAVSGILAFLYSIQRRFGIELPEKVKPLEEA